MRAYRSSTEIVTSLLEATKEYGEKGIRPTNLLTKTNLSYNRLTHFVENLTGSGLINKIEYDGKNTFVISPKGRQYLEYYQKFSSIAESFGLEL